jgi:hypothetical protein
MIAKLGRARRPICSCVLIPFEPGPPRRVISWFGFLWCERIVLGHHLPAARARLGPPAATLTMLQPHSGRCFLSDSVRRFLSCCPPKARRASQAPPDTRSSASDKLRTSKAIEAWRVNQTDVVRITRELCLLAFEHDPYRPYAWPRSR